MGCDIHSFAEVRKDGKWEYAGDVFPVSDKIWADIIKRDTTNPFYWRSYGMFGFLAGVRNYSHVPPIAEPLYAIPDDASPFVKAQCEDWEGDGHTHTWLTLAQLLAVDYEKTFWDRRVTKQTGLNSWDGAATAEEGEGTYPTLREFLGSTFFEHIEKLKELGAPEDVRIVFWFDN